MNDVLASLDQVLEARKGATPDSSYVAASTTRAEQDPAENWRGMRRDADRRQRRQN